MTVGPLKSRAYSPSSGISVQVTSELMDDYVFATDLTGASDLSVIATPDGTDRIFYLGQTGPMSLFQDETSDTGWTEEALTTPDQPLGSVDGAQAPGGALMAIGVGPNMAAPDLYLSRRAANGWGAWVPLPPPDAVPGFVYVANFKAMVLDDQVVVLAILNPTPGQPTTPSSLWVIDLQAKSPAWTQLAATDQMIIEPCTVAGGGPGVLFANSNEADPTLVDLFHIAAPFTTPMVTLASAVSMTDLAVGRSRNGASVVVVADNGYMSGARAISVLDCAHPQTGFSVVDATVTVTALAVTDQGDTPMAIFALDAQNLLNVIERNPVGWDGAVNLQQRLASITPALDDQDNGELLCWLPGKGLHRRWRSPSPEGQGAGPWTQDPIQYDPVNQGLSQQSTYATTLTFYDAAGAIMPNQALKLRASEIVSATLAGEVIVLGPDSDTACVTDETGRVRLTVETNALQAASFSVSAPGAMAADEDFHITTNAKVQKRLADISQPDLLQIIPAQFAGDVAQVQQAVQAAMTATLPSDGIQLVRVRPQGGHAHRTPLTPKGAQAFHLRVRPGSVVYAPLTPDQADAAFAGFADRPVYDAFGFFDFFEDVVDAIGDALDSAIDFVGDYIVQPVVNGLKVALDFTIGTIRYVVNVVIETAEQAFQAVESVFNAVLTVFKRLYEFLAWLLSGALKDIWATKGYLEQRLDGTVAQLVQLAGQGGKVSASFFAQIEQQIDQAFSQIEQQLTGIDLGQVLDLPLSSSAADGADDILEIVQGAGSISTWLMDKIEDVLFGTGINPNFPSDFPAKAMAYLETVFDAVTTAIQQAIDGFVKALQGFASSSANLAELALATILDAAKQAILLVLKVLDSLVEGFLTLMNETLAAGMAAILGAGISNVLITAVYDLINPGPSEPVTARSLGCLLCAFPVTVVYKILFDGAPISAGTAATSRDGVDFILSGLLGLTIWSWMDVLMDIDKMGEVPAPWKLIALIAVPGLINTLAHPNFGTVATAGTTVDPLKLAGWILGFGGPALVLVWGIGTKFQWGPRNDPIGCSLLSLLGLASLGVNIAQLVTGSGFSSADKAALVAGPLSSVVKPLKIAGKNPYALVPLVVTDVGSDFTAAIARVVKGAGMLQPVQPLTA